MIADDLKPGQQFTVEKPDPEGPVRVCLSNDGEGTIEWGFPGNDTFWCFMGRKCKVSLTN